MKTAEALKRAAALCSRQEKCAADIRLKLAQWEVTTHEAEVVLERLREMNFLNEQRYAEAFVREHAHINRWGRHKIRHALLQKEIPEVEIELALTQIDEHQYEQGLKKLLADKRRSLPREEQQSLRIKLLRFAASRGFEHELVSHCLKDLLNS